MNYLQEILDKDYRHLDEVIYVLICENDKFYVGHTVNLESRLKYGHFGNKRNRNQFLGLNIPIDVSFY